LLKTVVGKHGQNPLSQTQEDRNLFPVKKGGTAGENLSSLFYAGMRGSLFYLVPFGIVNIFVF
jgi:hypothetical protein